MKLQSAASQALSECFSLSGPGVEEALCESAALRRFVGAGLGVAPAPDETAVCRFRRPLFRFRPVASSDRKLLRQSPDPAFVIPIHFHPHPVCGISAPCIARSSSGVILITDNRGPSSQNAE